ncbi:MAG: hypothetical protein JWP45_2169 [Mucilaginibacter sp.]|nr:hypothetical protein [Mucilaginibacter sp.]
MNILSYTFRSNPDYKVIAWDKVQGSDKRPGSGRGPFILIPKDPENAKPIISLDLAEADIFFSLNSAQKLTPAHVTLFGENAVQGVIGMVYDNILQIQTASGAFEGGSNCESVWKLVNSHNSVDRPLHPLSKLSCDAISYAFHAAHLDENAITNRLYGFNTYPHIMNTTQVNPSKINDTDTRLRNIVKERNYHFHDSGYWLNWRHTNCVGFSQLHYKLYISPCLQSTHEVFRTIAEMCFNFLVPAFKIGKGVHGMLRPDKLVLYFQSMEAMLSVANELRHSLNGVDAQGVPFTNPTDTGALISWAIEPNAISVNYEGVTSWRMYVSKCISRSMKLSAFMYGDHSVASVLKRIRLNGIEPDNWNTILN